MLHCTFTTPDLCNPDTLLHISLHLIPPVVHGHHCNSLHQSIRVLGSSVSLLLLLLTLLPLGQEYLEVVVGSAALLRRGGLLPGGLVGSARAKVLVESVSLFGPVEPWREKEWEREREGVHAHRHTHEAHNAIHSNTLQKRQAERVG